MLVHREYVGIQMAGLSAPVTSMKFTEVDTVKEIPVTFPQGRFEKKITWCLWLKGPYPGWTFAQVCCEEQEVSGKTFLSIADHALSTVARNILGNAELEQAGQSPL